MTWARRGTTLVASVLALAGASGDALARDAGWRRMTLLDPSGQAAQISLALYYPTGDTARPVAMGPFTPHVAVNAPPDAHVKGLIVLSHGTGGSEIGHSTLATSLARHGYLVAALRHPGDNWQDRALLKQAAGAYFDARPRHVSRVIDALLDDPDWKDRIARDGRGPRIGALGHSAGGYTVLALAGGAPDIVRLNHHCAAARAADPVFCAIVDSVPPAAAMPDGATLRDPRVRAVAAMAPVGAVFEPRSLGAIVVPVSLHVAEADSFLVPRFHAGWIIANAPHLAVQREPDAGHFAYMDKPSAPMPTEDGDAGADPPGFDRGAFLTRLGTMLREFFDRALQ